MTRQEYNKQYYKKNKTKLKKQIAANNKKRLEDPEVQEHVKEYQKKYRDEHMEEKKAYAKKYIKEHKEEKRISDKLYYEANRDMIIERSKQYYKEHKEEYKSWYKQYYQEHKEEIINKAAKWAKDNPDKKRMSNYKWLRKYGIPESQKWRWTPEYMRWRKEVFLRDNQTCQTCQTNNCELHAHHIKKASEHPELRFNIDNGITLCKECHRQSHS